MHFKRTFFVLIFLVLAKLGAAQQKELADRIIATVGENIILQSDVEIAFLQEQSKQTEKVLSPDIKCTILDNLLLEKLFLAQGALDSVVVQEEEINAELDRRVKYFTSLFGSKEKLEAYYGKSTAELKDEFTEDVKNQLLSDRVRGKVFSGLKVSPKEVKDYFNRIPKDSIPLFNEEVEIGQIVMFPKVNDEQKALSKEKLLRIKKEIEAGADFSLQAILYSDDPGSASDGGNLGIVERGELVPDFEAAAYKLNEGQMSEIVETPFGFHLIRLDEKRGDKLKLRHILIKPKITNGDVLRVEEVMDSIAHQLKVDSLTFREAVKYFSEDETSKSVGGMMVNPKTGAPYFEKADIEGNLIFTLDQMKVGQYSDVLNHTTQERTGEMKKGYRIIFLKSETSAHKASLERDYAKIQLAAKSEKQQQEMNNWIELHKGNTFFKIDESMKGCAVLDKWTKETK
jgi:peptidyl-prolyl cis-trans isomerase SurA